MSDKWVKVKSFETGLSANLAKSFLEANDIECQVLNEHIVSMHFLYSNLVGGVLVKVKEADLERALELLEKGAGEDLQPPSED